MHYSGVAFGDGKTTITTKVSSFQNRIGRNSGVSDVDIRQILQFYSRGFACPVYQDCELFLLVSKKL